MRKILIVLALVLSLLLVLPMANASSIGASDNTSYEFGEFDIEVEVASPAPVPVFPSGGGGGGTVLPKLISSPDNTTELSVPLSTIIRDRDGKRIYSSNIRIRNNPDPPAPPSDTSIIGLAYDFEPSGATFNPPVTLAFTYDSSQLPEDVNKNDLVIAFYNEGVGEWIELECVVDTETMTVTASVSHFTTFALLCPIPEPVISPEPVLPIVEPSPTPISPAPSPIPATDPPVIEPPAPLPEPVKPPAPIPPLTPSPETPTSEVSPWGLIIGCVIGGLIIAGLAYLLGKKIYLWRQRF